MKEEPLRSASVASDMSRHNRDGPNYVSPPSSTRDSLQNQKSPRVSPKTSPRSGTPTNTLPTILGGSGGAGTAASRPVGTPPRFPNLHQGYLADGTENPRVCWESVDTGSPTRSSGGWRNSVAETTLIHVEANDDEEMRGCLLIDEWYLHFAVMVGVGVNAVVLGLELQWESNGWKTIWDICENVFTVFFLLEFLLKLCIMCPKRYFMQLDSWLDVTIVTAAIIDNWVLKLALDSDKDVAMDEISFESVLLYIRLLRILKLLNATRNMAMLVKGVVASMHFMVWLIFVLCICIYTIAIYAVDCIGHSDAYADSSFDNQEYFGNLLNAIVTGLNLALFSDVANVLRPVLEHQPLFGIGICVYMVTTSFAVLHAVVSLIVMRTRHAAVAAEQDARAAFQNEQLEKLEHIKELLYKNNTDANSFLYPEDVKFESDDLKEAMVTTALPLMFTATELHTMLDRHGAGELSKKEFQRGVKRLILADDFQRQCTLMLAISRQGQKLHNLTRDMNNGFRSLHKRFDSVANAGGHSADKAEFSKLDSFAYQMEALRSEIQDVKFAGENWFARESMAADQIELLQSQLLEVTRKLAAAEISSLPLAPDNALSPNSSVKQKRGSMTSSVEGAPPPIIPKAQTRELGVQVNIEIQESPVEAVQESTKFGERAADSALRNPGIAPQQQSKLEKEHHDAPEITKMMRPHTCPAPIASHRKRPLTNCNESVI